MEDMRPMYYTYKVRRQYSFINSRYAKCCTRYSTTERLNIGGIYTLLYPDIAETGYYRVEELIDAVDI